MVVSSTGKYHDYNAPRILTPSSFYSFNTNLIPVFPFHEACYRLLARSLFGDDDVEQIDKDALYSAMSQLLNYLPRSLKLDYGDLVSIEQTWECRSGEEVC